VLTCFSSLNYKVGYIASLLAKYNIPSLSVPLYVSCVFKIHLS